MAILIARSVGRRNSTRIEQGDTCLKSCRHEKSFQGTNRGSGDGGRARYVTPDLSYGYE